MPNKGALFATKGGCPRKGSPPFFILGGFAGLGTCNKFSGIWYVSPFFVKQIAWVAGESGDYE